MSCVLYKFSFNEVFYLSKKEKKKESIKSSSVGGLLRSSENQYDNDPRKLDLIPFIDAP